MRVGLLLAVVRAAEISPTNKQHSVALTLHALQMHATRSPARRLALVEAALRISDSPPLSTQPYLRELEGIYLKLRDGGAASNWSAAFSLPRDSAIGFCDHIRRIRRLDAWVDPVTLRVTPVANPPQLKVGVSSSAKIAQISATNYRAAPAQLDVDLTVKGKPVSLVVFGDNGVGKSTIVSALELACQGTVGRVSPTLADASLSLINLASRDEQATVAVTLSNGSRLARTVELVEGRWRVSGGHTLFDFSLSPITLQRADLVRFLSTPASQRGQLFVGQFAAEGTDDLGRAARERLKDAKAARRQFVNDLAGRAGHSPRVGSAYVNAMLNAIYLNGMSREQAKESRVRLPPEYADTLNRYRELEREVSEAKAMADRLPTEGLQSHVKQVKRLGNILGDVDAPLTQALVTVTGYTFVDRVEVTIGRSGALSLDMKVHLRNGKSVAPEQLFSEGVQDLLAILFFIEVAKAAAIRGQARVLVLDDVIQSVDATVRRKLLNHIVTDLKNWQLIITCHDRLWRDHVREALHKAGMEHREIAIRSWDFTEGPVFYTDQADASADLRAQIRRAGPRAVAGSAGLLLETMCNHLSWILPVSIPRARNDRYALGELWDSVTSKAKNSPELAALFNDIDKMVSLRNQLGAHYNQVADAIADAEADQFADLVLRLWDRVFCAECSDYVSKQRSKTYSCRCGSVRFTT